MGRPVTWLVSRAFRGQALLEKTSPHPRPTSSPQETQAQQSAPSESYP